MAVIVPHVTPRAPLVSGALMRPAVLVQLAKLWKVTSVLTHAALAGSTPTQVIGADNAQPTARRAQMQVHAQHVRTARFWMVVSAEMSVLTRQSSVSKVLLGQGNY